MNSTATTTLRLNTEKDIWYTVDHNVQKPVSRATALAAIGSLQKVAGVWVTFSVKAVGA